MAYSKTQWDEQTAITPERLNKIEDGIEGAFENIPDPAIIREDSSILKVELREDDPDPSDPENEGRIYLRTDL